jgi:UDP-glucose 4-epimerase
VKGVQMRILVTGGAGFIASHIVDRYIKLGHTVAVVDDLSAGNMRNVNPKASFFQVKIQSPDLKEVFSEFRPDIINHHAAHINLRTSVENPLHDADNNVMGSLNLLALAAEHNVKKCIFASTGGAIYGEPDVIPVEESLMPEPLSPYGINKLIVEHYLRIWEGIHNLDYTVLRYPNVYGPRQDPRGEAGVVAIFSLQMLSGKQSLIFGDGSKTRDYVYVSDVVNANVLALEKGSGNVLNLGWGHEISDMDVFRTVKEAVGSHMEPRFEAVRPGEVDRISLNALKAKKILFWEPKVSFKQGVALAVEFYKHLWSENQDQKKRGDL